MQGMNEHVNDSVINVIHLGQPPYAGSLYGGSFSSKKPPTQVSIM